MLRDLLSSRWFQGGFAFFVLCVGGSLLYSWHTLRTTENELERSNRFSRGTEQQKATRTAETVNVSTENETPDFVSTPDENTGISMSNTGEALPHETETLDLADAFLRDDMVSEEEAPAEDVPVSPYGFGPYPEVPVDYPSAVLWEREDTGNLPDDVLKDIELMDRVLVKLWSEGERGFKGGSFDGVKVYPHYHNTVYVRYDYDGDHRYISRARGGPEIPPLTPDQLYHGDLPEGIRTIDMDTAGIDPYSFLDF